MNIIHYVSSKNWNLLPFITTICNSCPVSSCRQRKTDASYERNVWKCGWLSFAAMVHRGEAGQHLLLREAEDFPSTSFLWEDNSSREVWSQSFHGRDIPKPGLSSTPGRDTQFPVQQPCLEPSPRRQISSEG